MVPRRRQRKRQRRRQQRLVLGRRPGLLLELVVIGDGLGRAGQGRGGFCF